jgi:alkanesulfonate monooxygenase SsuD/methylene tetrahydromethanopterin reductase-like flavin-dependent oxidoreductase (luciferase family)
LQRRGRLTDEHLTAIRAAWADDADYRAGHIPIWVGGHSDAGLRRAVRHGEAWHPLRFTLPWLRCTLPRLAAIAAAEGRPVPAFTPRIVLRLTDEPVTDPARRTGEGTIDQVMADLGELRQLGAETVVFDPFDGDTDHPAAAWRMLATVADHRDQIDSSADRQ